MSADTWPVVPWWVRLHDRAPRSWWRFASCLWHGSNRPWDGFFHERPAWRVPYAVALVIGGRYIRTGWYYWRPDMVRYWIARYHLAAVCWWADACRGDA